MNIKNVSFTGHRIIKINISLQEQLDTILEKLILQGATDFYAGGAVGWDLLCEHTVLSLRKKYPDIKLHLILPCSVEEQTKKWNEKQKHEYYNVIKAANTLTYISKEYHNGCMKERNAQLVSAADCLVCYFENKKSASGTGQTFRMAQKKGIKIYNLADL